MKFFVSLITFVLFSFSFINTGFPAALPAACSTSSLNCNSYLLYDVVQRSASDRNVGTSVWVPLPNQPVKTFHRIAIRDTGGQVMELGVGADNSSVTRHLIFGGNTGSSAETVVYPMGLTYAGAASSVYIRGVSGAPVSGENVINFLY